MATVEEEDSVIVVHGKSLKTGVEECQTGEEPLLLKDRIEVHQEVEVEVLKIGEMTEEAEVALETGIETEVDLVTGIEEIEEGLETGTEIEAVLETVTGIVVEVLEIEIEEVLVTETEVVDMVIEIETVMVVVDLEIVMVVVEGTVGVHVVEMVGTEMVHQKKDPN